MTYVSTCLADGAVGLYKLGEALSSSPAADETGIQAAAYGNTAGVTLGQTGIPGGGGATACRLVSASGGFVNAPDNASQHVGDTFTLEIWLKLAATGGTYGLMSAVVATGWNIRINPTGHAELLSQGAVLIGTSVAAITDTTTFHHIVWTKATATNHVYIDGSVSDGVFTNATIPNSAGWELGTTNTALDGTIAMFAIYPTALSAATVSNHYTLGNTGAPVSTPGFLPMFARIQYT